MKYRNIFQSDNFQIFICLGKGFFGTVSVCMALEQYFHATKNNMGLTAFEGARVQKKDVDIAKNYHHMTYVLAPLCLQSKGAKDILPPYTCFRLL